MRKLEVSFTPALLDYYDFSDSVVVIIDIFRATTTICTALYNGARRIIPVQTIDDCLSYEGKGYLLAAERDGLPIEGIDLDNSPLKFDRKKVEGETIVLTTTNGTYTLHKAKNCHQLIIASFLNLNAVCRYVQSSNKHVLIACSGTRNKFKLEDTICAGAIVEQVEQHFDYIGESSVGARELYKAAKQDPHAFVYQSSHAESYIEKNLQEDVKYCLKLNIMDILPIFKKGEIIIES